MKMVFGCAVLLTSLGCSKDPGTNLAPAASALAPSKPLSAGEKRFSLEPARSKIEFAMDAPKEKIRGRVNESASGEIHLDPTDLTKTTGQLIVDLSGLELYQAVADDSGKFSEEKKSDLQNKHARTWLEISDDAPEDIRKKNSVVQFAIRSVDRVSERDLSKMSGNERKVTLTATGDFLLHGRKSAKSVDLEALFAYEGDKPVSVRVHSVKPFGVDLAEHEVRPREAFGKLAQRTLEVLAPKVAKEALVSVDFTAKLIQ